MALDILLFQQRLIIKKESISYCLYLVPDAAIVDDILAIAVLFVVLTMVQTGNTTPDMTEITFNFEDSEII